MSLKFLFPSTIHNYLTSFSDCNRYKDDSKDQTNQGGQTSIEYILLLVVVMFMIISIMKTIKQRLIAEQNPCPISDKSLGCTISRSVSTFGTSDPSFRYFQIRR